VRLSCIPAIDHVSPLRMKATSATRSGSWSPLVLLVDVALLLSAANTIRRLII